MYVGTNYIVLDLDPLRMEVYFCQQNQKIVNILDATETL
jgi:uncharacterized protein YcsI (UPF0317 family)